MLPRTSKAPDTIGSKLRQKREHLKIKLTELADETQIPLKYLEALETDDLEIFSAKVYALGYLKKFMDSLAVNAGEGSELLHEFHTEWEVRTYHRRKENLSLPGTRVRPLITPTRILIGGSLAILFIIIGLFAVRLARYVGTPELSIRAPKNNQAFFSPIIPISGKVGKESQLTVNGREIKIDEAGFFEETIGLSAGVHVLKFLVKNRFGREDEDTRTIIIR